jgi:SAM-dependent methyltransferase
MQREQFVAHAALEDRHWWFTGRREILRALLHAVAPTDQGIPVLDIGCGTGGNAAAFAGEYDVMGIDPSTDGIAFARARFPAVRFEETAEPEAGRAHLARRGNGVVLLTDVLEHVADDHGLLAQAIAVVPSGGHLILTVPADPALWSRHDTDFGHFRRYQLADFRQLWHGAAVQQRLLSPFNARLRPVIAAIRRFAPNGGNNLNVPVGSLNGVLRRTFAGEAGALVHALDTGAAPFRRGVSLVSVLRKA